mmetsp:Transcript_39295/g.47590  ORF Transcript_39295/g.47590 Transcript_39295/m.47590 type:complete len:153 (+) Transcript_39295:425-883(+)|eukprot:CAMPEP_0197848324 /NCGR_PEP_ID=MMETSP1438-20131217/8281_1 /TAXON_ID=1461541 /ORGANISM="Pterosperma sp., Strain CCMP1384" /LENGTH=152 /DNA_ID=CAMNT_0043460499 /DNA_START=409 /DNA_END=867 /DNA_ORIENTATION=+
MAKKKGGGKKGGKKGKAPAFYTGESDLAPFGFKLRDIVCTPLGLKGTVIGVKYDSPENRESARLWVEYPGGGRSPLEPRLQAGFIGQHGYRRSSEAEHIWRDVCFIRTKMAEAEEARIAAEERARLRMEALALEADAARAKQKGGKRPVTAP